MPIINPTNGDGYVSVPVDLTVSYIVDKKGNELSMYFQHSSDTIQWTIGNVWRNVPGHRETEIYFLFSTACACMLVSIPENT